MIHAHCIGVLFNIMMHAHYVGALFNIMMHAHCIGVLFKVPCFILVEIYKQTFLSV
jgi:hypothetical protein